MKQQFLIFFLFFIMSCGPEEPQFTVPEEDLIKILYDIQVAEAALQTVHSGVKDSVVNIYYDQIFKIHGIDQPELMQNIERLKNHPEVSHKIYKKIQEYHKEVEKQKK